MPNWRSLLLFFHTIPFSVLGLLSALLDPSGRLFYLAVSCGWARLLFRMANINVTVKGLEHLNRRGTYVIASNHQSQLDIPLLFAALPFRIRFLAKTSLFFIPVFGWALFVARFIPVNRKNRTKARQSIERGARRIRKGPSLVIFPEGTRTPDGAIHPFKPGAFIMAIKAGVPILPVAIRGMYDLMPKTSVAIRSGRVELIIGPPIPTTGLKISDKITLLHRVQEAVETMFAQGE